MQLGKTLLGAVIGSAIGVGLILAIYYAFALDHTGLAVLLAVFAGLGVRMLVDTKSHASYLRGALTCVVAILAFAGCKFLIADLAARGAFAKPMKPMIARPVEEATEQDATASEPAQPAEARPPIPTQLMGGEVGMTRPKQSFSPVDIILLSIAALVAYTMGRGSEVNPAATGQVIPPPDAA
jgi:hypothetical protein